MADDRRHTMAGRRRRGSSPKVECRRPATHTRAVADRILAAVLFTDIVDSTRWASEMGDRAWCDLLQRHDALVDRALARYRGRKVTTTGDGVLAVFDAAARATACAAAIRDGVAALGLEVRAGVHAGEVELRSTDVAGVGVHIAARVMALAGPNEVLVSRTVPDLVAGSGLAFEDRGEHDLKGVPGTWRVFALC
jgi:class 3 adenylate cyclase